MLTIFVMITLVIGLFVAIATQRLRRELSTAATPIRATPPVGFLHPEAAAKWADQEYHRGMAVGFSRGRADVDADAVQPIDAPELAPNPPDDLHSRIPTPGFGGG